MKKPIPFGKYYLLDRIAVGGMAEIFKAKVIREEGFERYFAIKRILPSIAEDEEFIRMFIDEAKIAVQLTHSNIVPIIDLGKVGDAYFIAMEYVHGKDLRSTMEKMSKKNEHLPIPACCFVTMKICEGLDYAHNKKDAAGRDLNLVHRDVSPQNILISFDGEVKVIDFGIAKAANKAAKTQAGILKGKFGYMSPEQVRGLPLDRRSDIFAAGIVLYEILTGERLFMGDSDFSILEKVKNVEIIPPSTYNKNIPEDLERIVLKALAREVPDRYQTAIELHDDLQSFMYTHGFFFSRKDMAGLMKGIFPEEYEAEAQEMESIRVSSPPGAPGASAKPSTPPVGRKISAPPPPPPRMTKPSIQQVGSVPPPPPSRGRTSIPPPPPPKRTMIGMPAASTPQVPLPPPMAPVAPPTPQMVSAAPPPAQAPVYTMAGMPQQAQAPQRQAPAAPPPMHQAPPAQSTVAQPPMTFAQMQAAPTPKTDGLPVADRFTYPATEVGGQAGPPPQPEGLSMEWEDDEMETQIYEKLPEEEPMLPQKPPAKPAAPPPSKELEIPSHDIFDAASLPALSQPLISHKPRGVSLGLVFGIIAIGGVVIMGIMLLLILGKKEATLVVVPDPKTAEVKIDSRKIETSYPPTAQNLKPGKHTLIVTADGYETKVIELNLSEGQNTHVVTLSREKASGTGFSLETEPPGASVIIDNRPYPDRTPVRIIDLKEGTHTIRVEKENYLTYTTEVELRESEIIPIPKVVLSPKSITASITSIPDNAKVYLVRGGEKKYVGVTPYIGSLDPAGNYTVEVEKDSYFIWTGEVKFTPGRDAVSLLAQLTPAGKGGGEPAEKSGGGKKHGGGGKKHGGDGGSIGPGPSGGGTGFLSVSTQPWTIVYIDGQKIRNTPLIKYPLSSGQHKVRLINTQFNINQSYTVIIVSGQDTKIIKNLTQ